MTDKKRKPEDISRAFNQAMQEASEQYIRKNYKAPEIPPELLKKFCKRQKKTTYKRIVQIAAVFMVVLVGGVSMGIWINADGAYGGKKFISKVVSIISPLDIDQELKEDGSLEETVRITEEEKIEEARDFAEQLYVPEYIPKGYSFISLEISKDTDCISQDYRYQKGKEDFMVSVRINISGIDTDLSVAGKLYKSPVTGEEMYVETYEEEGTYSVARITDEADSFLNGTGDVKEGIKILENFKKR